MNNYKRIKYIITSIERVCSFDYVIYYTIKGFTLSNRTKEKDLLTILKVYLIDNVEYFVDTLEYLNLMTSTNLYVVVTTEGNKTFISVGDGTKRYHEQRFSGNYVDNKDDLDIKIFQIKLEESLK